MAKITGKSIRQALFRRQLADLELTQAALAERLDFSERQIRRYAAGTPVPRVVTMAMQQLYHTEFGGKTSW